ncbi:aromatic acid exporter family protein [Paenibacillaceae bacterium]|nr:aromatic acid exporter family protein [Paenibacillaceae bacterium]
MMGMRVIKTAAAGLAAIYTAIYLGLEPSLSAGLIAILGVEVTRMKNLKSAFIRMMASALGLLFASLIFVLFGFELWTLSLFVLITYPVLSRIQLKDGIVTSSVLVFHVFERKEVTLELLGNEIMLLITGLGWAIVVNFLYMPKEEGRLSALQKSTARQFSVIFTEMAHTLRDPAHVWNGEQLLQADKDIELGLLRSDIDRENRPWGYERYWRTYFEMRRQQLDSIQQMLVLIAFVYEKVPQGELLAEVFEQLAEEVTSDVYLGIAERELTLLEERYREMPLPASRGEFEVRAALLELLHELERFLRIAKRRKKQKAE